MQENKMTIIVVLVFVCNLVCSLFLWHLYDNKSREVDELRGKINLQKSLDETNSKLNDMVKREEEVYPKLLAQKNDIKVANQKLDELQAKLILVGKDAINAEILKMDIYGLSGALSSMGYPNKVISVGKSK